MLTVADTAYSIAVVRAEESDRAPDERLFEDPYASLFGATGAHAIEGTQRYLALPFFRDGIRLRTRYLDDFVCDGLASGIDQVVLLGAGFDARGHRLPEIAARKATVYEVDFAEQLENKRAILAAGAVTMPAWSAHVPCDFAAPDFDEALAASLDAHGFVEETARSSSGRVGVEGSVTEGPPAGPGRQAVHSVTEESSAGAAASAITWSSSVPRSSGLLGS